MKFIDEKGRLFGKVNIIDFMVILFLFCLIPMFYFGFKIFTQKPPEVKKDFIEVEINCNLIKVNPETLTLIKVGDKALDGYGEQIGEITLMGEIQPYIYKFFAGALIIKEKALKKLPVKIKLKAEIRDNNLYYNGKQIMNASPLIFETNKYSLIAIPDIKPQEEMEEHWLEVRVKFSELFPELSNAIRGGDIERDKEGRIIATLKGVLSKDQSLVNAVEIKEKRLIFVRDPSRNVVTAVWDLLCTEKNGTLYFKDYPIKIGNQIAFTTDIYTISGLIIGLDKSNVQRNN